MMDSDELAALAEDIKENGLIHPIVLGEWVPDPEEPEKRVEGIIDGRNRLAACGLAEVEPRFERFDGKDIAAFIVTTNINRRHLTKGQQAMALAMAYPEPEKGGWGNEVEAITTKPRLRNYTRGRRTTSKSGGLRSRSGYGPSGDAANC
jgi:ParB-like nuclease domain